MPAGAAVSAPEISVLSEHCCHLGEGPTYDPQSDTLYWFDILERKLLERKLAGGETRIHDLPEMASALAMIDAERQLVVAETGLHVRDARTGAMTLHTPIEAGKRRLRSNDARVHPCGALWIGTMGKKAEAKGRRHLLVLQGRARKLLAEITIPNSICFSPDGATAYYTDSRENVVARRLRSGDRPAAGRAEGLLRPPPRRRLVSTARSSTPKACCGMHAGARRSLDA